MHPWGNRKPKESAAGARCANRAQKVGVRGPGTLSPRSFGPPARHRLCHLWPLNPAPLKRRNADKSAASYCRPGTASVKAVTCAESRSALPLSPRILDPQVQAKTSGHLTLAHQHCITRNCLRNPKLRPACEHHVGNKNTCGSSGFNSPCHRKRSSPYSQAPAAKDFLQQSQALA